MTDLGFLHYFLGLQIAHSSIGIFVSQKKYALNMRLQFSMLDCILASTPFQLGVTLSTSCSSPSVDATLYRQLVRNLLYLTHSHLDLSFVVGLVFRFSQEPHESHW